jgi:hypothetical protein
VPAVLNGELHWQDGVTMRLLAVLDVADFIVCCVAPLIMTIAFGFYVKQFKVKKSDPFNKKFRKRFRDVIHSLSWKNRYSTVYFSIFAYRRLLASLLITTLS